MLNENETYILGFSPSHSQSSTIQEALIGALVTSEDNLGGADAKTCSSSFRIHWRDHLEMELNPNTDYGLDQITDINLLGSEYIFIKGECT